MSWGVNMLTWCLGVIQVLMFVSMKIGNKAGVQQRGLGQRYRHKIYKHIVANKSHRENSLSQGEFTTQEGKTEERMPVGKQPGQDGAKEAEARQNFSMKGSSILQNTTKG